MTPKRSEAELKKQNRQKECKLVEHIGKEIAKDATIVTLGTGESFAQYNRKRMSMSFDKEPGPSQPKKRKSHSPNDESINWNTKQVLIDLR